MAVINKQTDHKNMFQDANGTYRLPNPQEAVAVQFTSIGAQSAPSQIANIKDHKTIILLKGTGTAVFTKGTGFAGVKDAEIAVSGEMFMSIDSARFMDKQTGLINVYAKTGSLEIAVLEVR